MHAQQINLLEAMRLSEQDGASPQDNWMAWALAVLMLVTGLGVYLKGNAVAVLHREIAGLQQKKVFLSEEMGAAEAAMKDVVHLLARTLSKRVHWSELMREVSFVIPEGVWITRWESIPEIEAAARPPQEKPGPEKTGPQVKITGEALSQEQLTRFLSTLDRSPLLAGSRLAHARQMNGEVQFEVVVTLKTGETP